MIKQILNWVKKKKYHVLLWTCFVFYETVFLSILFDIAQQPAPLISHYLINISLFYLYTDLGLKWVFERDSNYWFRFTLILLGWCFLHLSLHLLIEYLLTTLNIVTGIPIYSNLSDYVLRSIYRGVYFLGFATGYYYLKTYLNEKKKSAELEKQHLEDIIQKQQIEQELTQAENAFLKAQINPHFLFNTLDFVYHEVNASSPRAGETIISLSNMMRYALDAEQGGEQLSLMGEIRQVEELLRIHQLRNPQLQLELHYENELETLRIIPLVLLTLTENMFKHGQLQQPASIRLHLDGDNCCIHTSNTISRTALGSSHQQGLENIRRRLDLAYGKAAELSYSQDGERFELRLKIAVAKMR